MPDEKKDVTIDAAIAPAMSTNMHENFFAYQQRWMKRLLVWALGSIAAGALLQLVRSTFWRQFSIQALAWGAIDAALALFSIRNANRKDAGYRAGEIAPAQVQQEACALHRLVLINTFLDIGYCVGGLWVWQRFRLRADRRGLGVGILVQGLWLLLFDGLLMNDIQKHWLAKRS